MRRRRHADAKAMNAMGDLLDTPNRLKAHYNTFGQMQHEEKAERLRKRQEAALEQARRADDAVEAASAGVLAVGTAAVHADADAAGPSQVSAPVGAQAGGADQGGSEGGPHADTAVADGAALDDPDDARAGVGDGGGPDAAPGNNALGDDGSESADVFTVASSDPGPEDSSGSVSIIGADGVPGDLGGDGDGVQDMKPDSADGVHAAAESSGSLEPAPSPGVVAVGTAERGSGEQHESSGSGTAGGSQSEDSEEGAAEADASTTEAVSATAGMGAVGSNNGNAINAVAASNANNNPTAVPANTSHNATAAPAPLPPSALQLSGSNIATAVPAAFPPPPPFFLPAGPNTAQLPPAVITALNSLQQAIFAGAQGAGAGAALGPGPPAGVPAGLLIMGVGPGGGGFAIQGTLTNIAGNAPSSPAYTLPPFGGPPKLDKRGKPIPLPAPQPDLFPLSKAHWRCVPPSPELSAYLHTGGDVSIQQLLEVRGMELESSIRAEGSKMGDRVEAREGWDEEEEALVDRGYAVVDHPVLHYGFA